MSTEQTHKFLFGIEAWELDVLWKSGMYLDNYCSKNCSADPVSEIVIDEN